MSDKMTLSVGSRYLLVVGNVYREGVEEYEVLELSPSEEWVKLKSTVGSEFWRKVEDITLVEELHMHEVATVGTITEFDGKPATGDY